jgi:diphthamide synthase (EF-2-diphthine--ammonia ligase)
VDGGFRAVVVCVDPRQLDPTFRGRAFDRSFLGDLPEAVDPCGENGEFHSLVTAGPVFDATLAHKVGQVVDRDGFTYCDVQTT